MKLPPLLCKLLCTMSHIAPQLSQRGRTLPQGNQKGEVVTSRAKQGYHVSPPCPSQNRKKHDDKSDQGAHRTFHSVSSSRHHGHRHLPSPQALRTRRGPRQQCTHRRHNTHVSYGILASPSMSLPPSSGSLGGVCDLSGSAAVPCETLCTKACTEEEATS